MDVTKSDAWRRLAAPAPVADVFDPAMTEDLPAPARRLLVHTLRPGVPLASTVVLDMTGEIRLRRWMPFHARQVLAANEGFVWAPRVGRLPLRISGADTLDRGRGKLNFRLWGLVPVARDSGPDTDRSAAGRLAAETVAWLPQALTPAMGAVWSGIDETRAIVAVPAGDWTVNVTVTVDADGRLREMTVRRWGQPDNRPAGLYPFGGAMDGEHTFDGVTIASLGHVGWWWDTPGQDDGVFFRFRVDRASFPAVDALRSPERG